jgi:signal transduction histidine kinase
VHTLRILGNLVENALRYSPRGSTVELRATREGDRLQFSVADRGPGVPPSEVHQIFEPFYRPPAAANDGGAGLGLSIAQRLAHAQGGAVKYAPRPGGGSVFSLQLPACDPD